MVLPCHLRVRKFTRVINEFRANQGKVGGQMAGLPLLLLTTTGAKTGRALTKPLAYTKDGESHLRDRVVSGVTQ